MRAVLFDGLVLGLQFGLLGVGLTLVYGLGGILNLAHGQMAVVAAISTALALNAGVPAVPAVFIGLIVGGLLGLLLDSTLMRPVYRQRGEARVLLSLLLTIGVGFVIDGLLVWRFPVATLRLNIGGGPIPIFGVPMRAGSLVATAVALIAAGLLVAFFRYSVTGRAVRSVIQDEEGARLVGVNPAAVRTLIFSLSGVLAGLVAVTRSMTSPIGVTAGINFTILALIVAVIGGLGSVAGSFLAGMILGVVNTISSFYIGTYITTIVLLTAAAATILIRPSGLLGQPE
ncbi:MAG TPA: branched-chain amino acid ABC transporter permease [Acidimicrobiia bacterium]|nr:branched-chain amino acid ABC transporter permease [Acidimicrobiia bacterium]